jgi:hypothetical protein
MNSDKVSEVVEGRLREADGIITTLLVHHAQFSSAIETDNFR